MPIEPSLDSTPAQQDTIAGRLWACPYYSFNRKKYAICRHYILKRISDVKQHLDRCHMLPQPDGISVEERQGMQRGRGTPEKQYQAIWEHLFPHIEAPLCPYILNPIEEGAAELWPSMVQVMHNYYPAVGPLMPAGAIKNMMELSCQVYFAGLPQLRHSPPARYQWPQAAGGQLALFHPSPGGLHHGASFDPRLYRVAGGSSQLDTVAVYRVAPAPIQGHSTFFGHATHFSGNDDGSNFGDIYEDKYHGMV